MESKTERIKRIRSEISRLSRTGYDVDQITQLREELHGLKVKTPVSAKHVEVTDSDKKKKGRKTKAGGKMSPYQVHVADCRAGKNKFEGQGTKGFDQCVEIWNNLKKNRGD
jgi:hypothetical protein